MSTLSHSAVPTHTNRLDVALIATPDPRESWPAWVDADTWELGPEPAPEPKAATPKPRSKAERDAGAWFGEIVARAMTFEVLNGARETAFNHTSRASRDAFFDFLEALNCPVATWAEWLELCRSGSPVSFPEPVDGHRPEPEPFQPSATDEAYRLGFTLGFEHEPASGPASPADVAIAFRTGFLAGVSEQERELNDWLDSLPRPEDDDDFDALHPIERIEAGPMVRHWDA